MQPYYVLARKRPRSLKEFCLDIIFRGMFNKMYSFYAVKNYDKQSIQYLYHYSQQQLGYHCAFAGVVSA